MEPSRELEARILVSTMPETAMGCEDFEEHLTDYLDGFLPPVFIIAGNVMRCFARAVQNYQATSFALSALATSISVKNNRCHGA